SLLCVKPFQISEQAAYFRFVKIVARLLAAHLVIVLAIILTKKSDEGSQSRACKFLPSIRHYSEDVHAVAFLKAGSGFQRENRIHPGIGGGGARRCLYFFVEICVLNL